MIVICKEMGWTYQEFMRQPVWFVDLLAAKMIIEADYMNKLNQQKYGSK